MSEATPKFCPYCGKNRAEVIENPMRTLTYVWCPDCRMQGPAFFSAGTARIAAIAAWNGLPRPLRWTQEAPKEPGWYWTKGSDFTKKAWLMEILPYELEMAEWNINWWWAGPIQTPEESEK